MRFCWAQYSLWAVIALLGLLSMLSGCGARGPLELPPEIQARIARDQQQQAERQKQEWQWQETRLRQMQQHLDTAYPTIAPLKETDAARGESVARLYAQLREDALQPLADSAGSLANAEVTSPRQQLAQFKQLLQRLKLNLDSERRAHKPQGSIDTLQPSPSLSETEIVSRMTLLDELIWRVDAETGGLLLQRSPFFQQTE